ncbi:hypothetical protein DV738_g927, partial [Chaetothyriales sp. CBS 135597]
MASVVLDYASNLTSPITNTTWSDLPGALPFTSHFVLDSPVTTGLAGVTSLVLTFLAYVSYTPKVDPRSPAFTTETYPIIGSWKFFTEKMKFWRSCIEKSKNGSFSFWLGKTHVVGVSGEAARKMYLDNRSLNLIEGIVLIGHGPDFIDGRSTKIHDIWKPLMANGKTYAQRRLLDQQKSDKLIQHLPKVTHDARKAFEDLGKNGSSVTNPATTCFKIVITQGTRIVGTDEISENPALLGRLMGYLPVLQRTSSLHLLSFPYLSYFSRAYWRRKWGRWGVESIVKPIVERRMAPGGARRDDALQVLIDNGDSKDWITNYLTSMLFIAGANAGVLSGAMLNIVAHHADWQDKIYQEIKRAASIHSKNNKEAPLVDQLADIPLSAWETSFPSIDLCYKEAIRMWVAFPMGRLNDTKEAIPIPGTDEVIPPGAFACYNTIDVHYNDKLYPDPMRWDPERFRDGREEYKNEAYGFMGWGQGRHPCVGMRWAKLQQNIILAYALALYKWQGCDADGNPDSGFRQPTHALNELAPSLPQVATLLLYLYVSRLRYQAKQPWRQFALAGFTTILIVPFTLTVMVQTNDELFRLQALTQSLAVGLSAATAV